jgi:hypothetical protein
MTGSSIAHRADALFASSVSICRQRVGRASFIDGDMPAIDGNRRTLLSAKPN